MKFVQVLPVIETGAAKYFDFTDVEIAVMCSSHNAEPEHIAAVRSILHKAVSGRLSFLINHKPYVLGTE